MKQNKSKSKPKNKDTWLKQKLGKQVQQKRQRDGKEQTRMPKKPTGNYIFGKHAVEAAVKAGRRKVHEIFVAQDTPPKGLGHIKTTRVEKEFFDQFHGQVHQYIAAKVGALPSVALQEIMDTQLVVVLDQISDPHNFGAILRSADAFGAGGILVPTARSAPITDVVAKTAAGALETLPIVEANLAQALKQLQKEGFWVIGLDGHAKKTITQVSVSPNQKIVLVLGSEGEGLRDLVAKTCDEIVKLPMTGTVESLNVSVAAGVALFVLQATR